MDGSIGRVLEQSVMPVFPVHVMIPVNPADPYAGIEDGRQLLTKRLFKIHITQQDNRRGMRFLHGPEQGPPFAVRIAIKQNACSQPLSHRTMLVQRERMSIRLPA